MMRPGRSSLRIKGIKSVTSLSLLASIGGGWIGRANAFHNTAYLMPNILPRSWTKDTALSCLCSRAANRLDRAMQAPLRGKSARCDGMQRNLFMKVEAPVGYVAQVLHRHEEAVVHNLYI